MAARENGYCTSFILMSAQLDWEGFEGMSHFPRSISLWGRGGREGVRVEGRFSGRVGRLRSISASRGYWGTFLVFFFLIWQCMKLATKEATTRTPENRQESMRERNQPQFQLR